MKEIWLLKRKYGPLYGSMFGGAWPGFTKYLQIHDFGRFLFPLACLLTLDQITGIRTLSDGNGHRANQRFLGMKLRKILPLHALGYARGSARQDSFSWVKSVDGPLVAVCGWRKASLVVGS